MGTYILIFCRITTGIVFMVSFLTKASNIPEFLQSIIRFHLLPKWLSKTAVRTFLIGELAIAISMLWGGGFLIAGFLLTICLITVFTLALISVLVRQMQTPCHCFGSSTKIVSRYHVWRNIGFLCCAAVGLMLSIGLKNTQVEWQIPELILIGIVSTVSVLVWLQADEIWQLVHS